MVLSSTVLSLRPSSGDPEREVCAITGSDSKKAVQRCRRLVNFIPFPPD
jgi:hypothetical protein